MALLHDSFKFKENKGRPRDWNRHHAILARKYAQDFIVDQLVLDLIELHDEAYYAWRMIHIARDESGGTARLDRLRERIRHFMQEYYLFFKCDTCTGDKIAAPLLWWENQFEEVIEYVEGIR